MVSLVGTLMQGQKITETTQILDVYHEAAHGMYSYGSKLLELCTISDPLENRGRG